MILQSNSPIRSDIQEDLFHRADIEALRDERAQAAAS
jgi:hypothetical protein